jgi:hypothetical protein
MMTAKIPPKKAQAASHASMARAVVSSKVGYTKRWRERTAVKIQARRERGDAFRLQLPEPGGA